MSCFCCNRSSCEGCFKVEAIRCLPLEVDLTRMIHPFAGRTATSVSSMLRNDGWVTTPPKSFENAITTTDKLAA